MKFLKITFYTFLAFIASILILGTFTGDKWYEPLLDGLVPGLICLLVISALFSWFVCFIQKMEAKDKSEADWINRNVSRTHMIDSYSITSDHGASIVSGLVRSSIGHAIGGKRGGLLGAMSARRKTSTTRYVKFRVVYIDDSVDYETVDSRSLKYKCYMRKCDN